MRGPRVEKESPGGQDQGKTGESFSTSIITPARPAVYAETIAQARACGRPGCGCGKRQGKGWTTHCPAHVDTSPSLSITNGDDGKILVHCHGGCPQEAVIAALRSRGLWPEAQRTGLTMEELAAAKGLPVAFLRDLGVRDGVVGQYRDPCVDILFCDERGEIRAVHKRLRLVGEPRFVWRKGDHVLPYGLTRLSEARAADQVVLVEGETDCWALWLAGIPALGVPGANTWRPEWVRHLQGVSTIYVWHEPDAGGDTLAAKVIMDFPNVRVIETLGKAKDASALFLLDRPGFAARMADLLGRAKPASELRAEALGQEAREAFKKAQDLLLDPHLLGAIDAAICAGGFAGDTTPAKLAYIALTSRLLSRPLNIAFVAASAAGKNRAIDAALALMPPSAYYLEGAGSARALVYGDTDFQHKTVIVAEADSIPEEGPAASAIRSLAEDNAMRYDVVERDPDTGKFGVRHIIKPGPTGLITTSTKSLGEQMGTRLLEVGLSDTPEQTRAVLGAHAAAVSGASLASEADALVAVQQWLQLAGEHDVLVPFAGALAALVPAGMVRMRRDFRQLLTVIQAVTLLHQCQRDRDVDGHLVATLEDYRIARGLLLQTFTEVASGGVSRAVRQTVKAVGEIQEAQKGEPVTTGALGRVLKLERSAVWRRVQSAVRLGLLVNKETREHQPARLVLGEPLPEEKAALPTVEEVEAWVMSPYHPETTATLQQAISARYDAVSEDTVAHPHATGVQQEDSVATPGCSVAEPLHTPLQQAEGASTDTKTPPESPGVAVLHPDPDEEDTPIHVHPTCPHRPPGEVEDRWAHHDGGPDAHACACCGGPVAPDQWQDGLCSVCRNGHPVKDGSGHLVRLAFDLGAKVVRQ